MPLGMQTPCPQCGEVLYAREDLLHEPVRCPVCGNTVKVAPTQVYAAPAIRAETEGPVKVTSSLATIALTLSLLGLCCGVTPLAGVPLGIVALIQIRRSKHLRGTGIAVGAIVGGILVMALVGAAVLGVTYAGRKAKHGMREQSVANCERTFHDMAARLKSGEVEASTDTGIELVHRLGAGMCPSTMAQYRGPKDPVPWPPPADRVLVVCDAHSGRAVVLFGDGSVRIVTVRDEIERLRAQTSP